jgi:hypothetical protein
MKIQSILKLFMEKKFQIFFCLSTYNEVLKNYVGNYEQYSKHPNSTYRRNAPYLSRPLYVAFITLRCDACNDHCAYTGTAVPPRQQLHLDSRQQGPQRPESRMRPPAGLSGECAPATTTATSGSD